MGSETILLVSDTKDIRRKVIFQENYMIINIKAILRVESLEAMKAFKLLGET
jgi:hypothetical protein